MSATPAATAAALLDSTKATEEIVHTTTTMKEDNQTPVPTAGVETVKHVHDDDTKEKAQTSSISSKLVATISATGDDRDLRMGDDGKLEVCVACGSVGDLVCW
jgi:hypothetical protein